MKGLLVGLGGRARSWLNVCNNNANVELVGYVELSGGRREAVTRDWNLPPDRVFPSIEAAVQNADADFVCDVTPPAAHEPVAMEAFQHGLHVIGEKPMSDTFEAALRMTAAAKESGLTHMVAQNYRFGAVPRTTRRLLDEGVIGAPKHAVVGFYKAWASRPGSHYTTMPYPLITDMGIHHFDMLRYVLNREPVSVYAQTWNPEWGWHAGDAGHTAIFQFEGGLTATHHALGSSVGKSSPWNGEWRIEGPNGSLTWEEDAVYRTAFQPAKAPGRQAIPLDKPPLQGQDALLAEFVSAISEGREPECSSQDNIKSMAMVFAGIKSSQEGREVNIAEMMSSE